MLLTYCSLGVPSNLLKIVFDKLGLKIIVAVFGINTLLFLISKLDVVLPIISFEKVN